MKVNVQDTILNQARKNKIPVSIYLMNGVPLTGSVLSFDKFTIVVQVNGRMQMVYKHAISTISLSKPVPLLEGEE